MKNIFSYLFMSLLFFNIIFIFYYYFKIISFLYVDLFHCNVLTNIILVNLIVLVIDVFYILIYKCLNLYKLSYFSILFLGGGLGALFSFLFNFWGNYLIEDYLSIISYFIINTIFISYSLSFEKENMIVFE